jgi:hypothetical protein
MRQHTLKIALSHAVFWLTAWLIGLVLITALSQYPAHHTIDIGGYDAAYVQGFHDTESHSSTDSPPPYLVGSDGRVRWSRDHSFLLLPQAGLPATVTIRLRGWRPPTPNVVSPVVSPTVRLYLHTATARHLVAAFPTDGSWQEHHIPITHGYYKPNDVVLEIESDMTVLPDDDRTVGVVVDRVSYRVEPGHHRILPSLSYIAPYPAQLAYGSIATLLIWLLTTPFTAFPTHSTRPSRRQWRIRLLAYATLGLSYLFLFRLQPHPYPYPLRTLLPTVDLILATVAMIRFGPPLFYRLSATYPSLVLLFDWAAGVGIVVWGVAVWWVGRAHVTLSVPGVEKDFRVFATRAFALSDVLQTDGFYQLGYPFLLWFVRPFTDGNPFLAGRLVGVMAGVGFLAGSYFLARAIVRETPMPGGGGVLLALIPLCLSPFVVQYSLYVGSDMACAALFTLSVALLLWRPRLWSIRLVAGLMAGGSFLMRHPALILLPWGILTSLLLASVQGISWRDRWRGAIITALPFTLGFLVASMPQLVVNVAETGELLYSHQAKNIWLAVYGNTDWGRWHEVPDTISLHTVVLKDPLRVYANWWGNVRAFVGTGAEDTREFGRAIQLRLLGFPANWLAIAGIGGWMVGLLSRQATRRQQSLLLLILLYVAGVSVGFVLPRFFLPLVPIYAVAAGWAAVMAANTLHDIASRWMAQTTQMVPWMLLIGMALLLMLFGGFRIGADAVLNRQTADEQAIITQTLAALEEGEQVVVRVEADVPIAKYSALSHRTLSWPTAEDVAPESVIEQMWQAGVTYLLWSNSFGPPPLPATQHPIAHTVVAQAGKYTLYRLE